MVFRCALLLNLQCNSMGQLLQNKKEREKFFILKISRKNFFLNAPFSPSLWGRKKKDEKDETEPEGWWKGLANVKDLDLLLS